MNKIQIPWEERPVGCTDVMWRYSQNPVIGRYHPIVFSIVLSYLSKMGSPAYSVVTTKLYR